MTNEELKKTLEKMNRSDEDAEFVDLDDEFEFGCIHCGACCSGRDDIILTPYDVYNIALALNKEPSDIIQEYTKLHIGATSYLPIITIDKNDKNLCPFLELDLNTAEYKCSIENYKPSACASYPFGTVRSIDKATGESTLKFIKTKLCHNHNNTKIKVRDYLENFLKTDEERCAGHTLITFMSKMIDFKKLDYFLGCDLDDKIKAMGDINQEDIEEARNRLCKVVYSSYLTTTFEFEMDKTFLEQIEKKKEFICIGAFHIITIMKMLGVDIAEKGYLNIIKEYVKDEELQDLQDFIERRINEDED